MSGPARWPVIRCPPRLESATVVGITQWDDRPKEWKQEAEAYGERFGSSYGIHIIRGTLEYGASSALHEDNRYFRSHETGFWKRSQHAIANMFIARNDAGDEHFAYSRVGSAAGAVFISRIWQPHSTNGAGEGAAEFGLAMAGDLGRNIFLEFWPDMKHRFLKKK